MSGRPRRGEAQRLLRTPTVVLCAVAVLALVFTADELGVDADEDAVDRMPVEAGKEGVVSHQVLLCRWWSGAAPA